MNNGTWKFDQNVAPEFDDHIRQHVPMYDEIQRLVADIATWFIQDNTNVYDIGTATGEVINRITEATRRQATYIGIDTSPEMVELFSERFHSAGNIMAILGDAADREIPIQSASLVVSMLTVQFLPIEQRQPLINKIYNGLNPGGAFLMVEKVRGGSAQLDDIWTSLYHDLKLRNGVSEDNIIAKSKALRGVLRPLSFSDNLDMLRLAGFTQIDVFFKWNNFVGIVGVK